MITPWGTDSAGKITAIKECEKITLSIDHLTLTISASCAVFLRIIF